MKLTVGEAILVKGKTKKGKERIEEHGDVWTVVLFSETVWKNVPSYLLQAQRTNYRRWMYQQFDPDFEVI